MGAPVQVGAARTASTTPVFAVFADPSEGVFARATSAWASTRSGPARQVFAQRLAQMAPQDKSAVLKEYALHTQKMREASGKLDEQWMKALGEMRQLDQERMKQEGEVSRTGVTARGQLRAAELRDATDRLQLQEFTPEQMTAIADMEAELRKFNGSTDPNAEPSDDPATVEASGNLAADIAKALEPLDDPDGPLATLKPMQRQQLSQRLHAALGTDTGTSPGGEAIDAKLGRAVEDNPANEKGAVTSRNLGGRAPKLGDAYGAAKDAYETLGRERQQQSVAGPDPATLAFEDELRRMDQRPKVDFNAPLIRDEAYARPWDAVEDALARPGESGTEFGNQFATLLKSATQRGKTQGYIDQDTLQRSADQRREFTGPISTPEPPVRGARVTGGEGAAAMAAPPQRHGLKPAGPAMHKGGMADARMANDRDNIAAQQPPYNPAVADARMANDRDNIERTAEQQGLYERLRSYFGKPMSSRANTEGLADAVVRSARFGAGEMPKDDSPPADLVQQGDDWNSPTGRVEIPGRTTATPLPGRSSVAPIEADAYRAPDPRDAGTLKGASVAPIEATAMRTAPGEDPVGRYNQNRANDQRIMGERLTPPPAEAVAAVAPPEQVQMGQPVTPNPSLPLAAEVPGAPPGDAHKRIGGIPVRKSLIGREEYESGRPTAPATSPPAPLHPALTPAAAAPAQGQSLLSAIEGAGQSQQQAPALTPEQQQLLETVKRHARRPAPGP